VSAVLIARDIEDFGRPDFALGDLLDDWSSSQLDLERDVAVSETPEGASWATRSFAPR